MVVHVGKPIYPDLTLSLAERKAKLRKKVYDFMLDMSAEDENVEYISYVRAKDDETK